MTRVSRRTVLSGFLASASLLALSAPSAPHAAAPSPFDRETVVERARLMAAHPYRARPEVPQDWRDLSYEDYQTRWFRSRDALWSRTNRSYNVDFFLPGLYFPRAVQLNTVENGLAQLIPFDLSLFDKTDKAPDLSTEGALGYSGLRLRTELSEPGKKNEFCVFQGASYFRAIGIGQTYGLSARGLALNTGEGNGEEFPEFIEFWLEAPSQHQKHMVIHALMDSPSVTGAYQFTVLPGENCIMDVEATLFAREDLSHAGIAPLTSMFLFDRTNRNRFDDFRPAVHDSDGLLMVNGNGETLWRPLANPHRLQVSSFVDDHPHGFGLMQRARKLSDFDDLEAHYHNRPCLWVEPKGDWGKGSVTLVEIPADKEIYDNIVAYWRPQTPVPAGGEFPLSYRLTWGTEPQQHLPRVVDTAAGARVFGAPGRIMTIEYEAHPLLNGPLEDIEVFTSSPHVETSTGVLQRNPETGGARLAFSFDPGPRNHVELRAQLRKAGAPVSEVWLYRWTA